MKRLSERPIREDLVTQACLEAYGAVRHEGRLADRALEHLLRSKRELYSSERRVIAERVYALLRRQRLVDFLALRALRSFDGLTSTRQDLFRLAVSRTLEGASPVSVAAGLAPVERAALETLDRHRAELAKLGLAERLAIETSHTDFFAAKLIEEFGDDAHRAAEAMNHRGPLCIRVNELKTTREEVAAALEAARVKCRPTELSPLGLILETRENVYALEPFRAGLFEVQDEGSQLLGMLVDAPPRKVVDACAGAGGKTLQVAGQMKNRGELFALDVDARRLGDLRQRCRRAGAHNVRVSLLEDGPDGLDQLSALRGAAERVLVDAPCSGSGTFRRKPDARYRLDAALLADHVTRQHLLLNRFCELVKPKGRLIYGTCSLLRDENEAVVERFLATHSEFEIADASAWLGSAATSATRGGMLRVYPHRHGTDGFFGAVMIRRA